jgi:hypothetical protein
MKLASFTFNPLQENTYVLWCEDTLECAIVDAGNYNIQENQILKSFIQENGLKPTHLLGTHGHIDHIFGNWFVKQEWNIPYYLHKEDITMLGRSIVMAGLWNLQLTPSQNPDFLLEHGEIIKIGNSELEVRFVPGHAPGHVVFINHKGNWGCRGRYPFSRKHWTHRFTWRKSRFIVAKNTGGTIYIARRFYRLFWAWFAYQYWFRKTTQSIFCGSPMGINIDIYFKP